MSTSIIFGTEPAAQSRGSKDLAVSDDGKAFTLRYSDFQVDVDNGPSTPTLVNGRWEWIALPLTDSGQGVEITFGVSGYAFCGDGAQAAVVISVNGRRTVAEFPPGTDREFVESMTYLTTGADREVRIAVGVLAEDGSESYSAASVTISAIDGNIPITV